MHGAHQRLELLSQALDSDDLRTFYAALAQAEGAHARLFVDLAKEYGDPDAVEARRVPTGPGAGAGRAPVGIGRVEEEDRDPAVVPREGADAQARRDGQAEQIEVDKSRIRGQEAALVGTRASMDEAKRDLDRNRDLVASGDVSRTTYEQAQRRYDELASQYNAAEANLESSVSVAR